MDVIVKFQKIKPSSPYAGVGVAGNIMMVMNAMLNHPNKKFYIDMESNKVICSDDEIDWTNNAWEYYFNQNKDISSKKTITLRTAGRDINRKIEYLKKRYTNNSPIIKQARNLFFKNFSFHDLLIEEFEKIKEDLFLKNDVILGIQIRLTDMSYYHKVPNLESYVSKVKKILREQPNITKLFIATDDDEVLEEIQKQIKIPVIFQKNILRASKDNKFQKSYERFYNKNRKKHHYLMGKEVILDALLLSVCQFLLNSQISSVSILALIFGDNIQKVFHL